jgi:hypothetical protein
MVKCKFCQGSLSQSAIKEGKNWHNRCLNLKGKKEKIKNELGLPNGGHITFGAGKIHRFLGAGR